MFEMGVSELYINDKLIPGGWHKPKMNNGIGPIRPSVFEIEVLEPVLKGLRNGCLH